MSDKETSIREFITSTLEETARHFRGTTTAVGNADNLMATGVLDSLGFVSLMSAIEIKFNVELEFDGSDPEQFMTVDGLVSKTLDAISKEQP